MTGFEQSSTFRSTTWPRRAVVVARLGERLDVRARDERLLARADEESALHGRIALHARDRVLELVECPGIERVQHLLAGDGDGREAVLHLEAEVLVVQG